MKKVLFIAVVLIFATTCNAQPIEAFVKFDQHGLANKDVNMAYFLPLSGDTASFWSRVKFTSFILVESNWGEQTFGFAYAPAPWIEVGLSAGFEQSPHLLRGCATLWVGKGKFSSFTAFELGGGNDNWWFRNITKYQATKKLAVGFQGWRYNGLGPLASYEIIKHVNLWANPVWDPEKHGLDSRAIIVGLGLNF